MTKRFENRLRQIRAGEIVVDGEPLRYDVNTSNRLRANIGMVFQNFNLFPHLPAIENVIVHRIITDLAAFDVDEHGLCLTHLAPGVTVDELTACTDAPFRVADTPLPFVGERSIA